MRIFLIGWGDAIPETADVIEELALHGHQIIYWTRSNDVYTVEKNRFPQTIFHELREAAQGNPAPDVTDKFDPPSLALIKQMAETESMAMTMMNKRYDWMGISQRKRLYYKMLGYWHGVLRNYAPDIIIFPAVPHSVYDYIIYWLAKFFGIKTIMFDTTLVANLFLVLNDYTTGSASFQQELKNFGNTEVSLTDLSIEIQTYYKQKSDPQDDSAPLYILEDKERYGSFNLVKVKFKMILAGLKDNSLLEKTAVYFFKHFKSNLKKDYLKLETKPDLAKPFVYVPLNYQPEATTCPLGEAFVDQILMIETLAAALPEGWVLYVKEHPVQWLARGYNYVGSRYQGYYEMIANIPNVKVIPVETNSIRLVDACRAVATVTGTAGWEAILRGKPALVFGHPWYQDYPELFKVHDVASCRLAFETIVKGFVPTPAATFRFLACLKKAAVYGYMDEYNRDHTQLTKAQNKDNIFKALLAALEAARV